MRVAAAFIRVLNLMGFILVLMVMEFCISEIIYARMFIKL